MLRDPEARLRPLDVILGALMSHWMDGKSQHRLGSLGRASGMNKSLQSIY